MEEVQKSMRGDIYVGDLVFAAQAVLNDGSHPEFAQADVLANAGTRGVIVRIGHPEEQPDKELFLVRFESESGSLGPPVGCWPQELDFDESGKRAHKP